MNRAEAGVVAFLPLAIVAGLVIYDYWHSREK